MRVPVVNRLLLIAAVIGLWHLTAPDGTTSPIERRATFHQRHQAGVRLGVWVNNGQMPPAVDTAGRFETDFNDASFYFEVYAGYRLWKPLIAEISFGIVNRGGVTFIDAGGSNVGNVLIHPILVQLRAYPLAPLSTRFHPFITIGGGLYYGRRTVQFTTSPFVSTYGLNEDNGTDFNLVAGAGIDWPVAPTIALEASFKYMPIHFSEGLQTISDYDGLAFTLGLKYLFLPKK